MKAMKAWYLPWVALILTGCNPLNPIQSTISKPDPAIAKLNQPEATVISVGDGDTRAGMTIAAFSPGLNRQGQQKARQYPLSRELRGQGTHLYRLMGAIDLNLLILGVHQPPQAHPIGDVILQLQL